MDSILFVPAFGCSGRAVKADQINPVGEAVKCRLLFLYAHGRGVGGYEPPPYGASSDSNIRNDQKGKFSATETRKKGKIPE